MKLLNKLKKKFLNILNFIIQKKGTIYNRAFLNKGNYIDAEIYMRKLYRMNFTEAMLPMAIISRKMVEIYCLEAIEEDVSNAHKIYEQIKK